MVVSGLISRRTPLSKPYVLIIACLPTKSPDPGTVSV